MYPEHPLINWFSFINLHKCQFSPKQTAWPSLTAELWVPIDWRGWLKVLWSVKHDCECAFKCAWSEITHNMSSWHSAISRAHLQDTTLWRLRATRKTSRHIRIHTPALLLPHHLWKGWRSHLRVNRVGRGFQWKNQCFQLKTWHKTTKWGKRQSV